MHTLQTRAARWTEQGLYAPAVEVYRTHPDPAGRAVHQRCQQAIHRLRQDWERVSRNALEDAGSWGERYEFSEPDALEVIADAAGIDVNVHDGICEIRGTPSGAPWRSAGVKAPLLDLGAGIRTTVRFMWPHWPGPAILVLALEGAEAGPLMMLCQGEGSYPEGSPVHGYFIQTTRWANRGWEMVAGSRSRQLLGNERRRLNTMGVCLLPNRHEVEFSVNHEPFGRLRFEEPIGTVENASVYFQTSQSAGDFRIVVDDLEIRQFRHHARDVGDR
jgi:hypothetical protein